MHLWFLVHGLYGDVGNMQTMQEILVDAIPKSDHVHIASSNEQLRTFDGIEVGALRLYNELLHVVDKCPTAVTHISIVGYSLGGLYTRFLIGLLEESSFFESVKPVVYATFASPHLGSTQWKPKYCSWLLNGLGTVFLGVSGAQLVCRWNWALLQKLSEPDSKYYIGLKRFKRRFLFANAVNDRSVHFWTAFITNKVPFAKDRAHNIKLVYYSYNDNPKGRFIVDLQRSQHVDRPSIKHERSLNIAFPIIMVLWAVFMFILFFVSMSSFISQPFLLMKWRRKYRSLRKRVSIAKLASHTQHAFSSDSPPPTSQKNEIHKTESRAQRALDTLPPEDNETDDEDSVVSDGPTTSTYPQPVLDNKAAFVDSAPEELPFSETLTRRMNNLNSLGWEKYVVYLNEHWSHAHIINRRHETDSQGTELIKFFVEQAINTDTESV